MVNGTIKTIFGMFLITKFVSTVNRVFTCSISHSLPLAQLKCSLHLNTFCSPRDLETSHFLNRLSTLKNMWLPQSLMSVWIITWKCWGNCVFFKVIIFLKTFMVPATFFHIISPVSKTFSYLALVLHEEHLHTNKSRHCL